eukprot:TRINITY_DN6955_c0_g1_i1.p1 TRINITY_DN6955_c0_g1~~TRINITY_DN6955_c0_g1_i1.p1  ORF type:complete len:383 (+),score=100.30 TRINITY_DN6955_c0_g1_i1:46-1149(+)
MSDLGDACLELQHDRTERTITVSLYNIGEDWLRAYPPFLRECLQLEVEHTNRLEYPGAAVQVHGLPPVQPPAALTAVSPEEIKCVDVGGEMIPLATLRYGEGGEGSPNPEIDARFFVTCGDALVATADAACTLELTFRLEVNGTGQYDFSNAISVPRAEHWQGTAKQNGVCQVPLVHQLELAPMDYDEEAESEKLPDLQHDNELGIDSKAPPSSNGLRLELEVDNAEDQVIVWAVNESHALQTVYPKLFEELLFFSVAGGRMQMQPSDQRLVIARKEVVKPHHVRRLGPGERARVATLHLTHNESERAKKFSVYNRTWMGVCGRAGSYEVRVVVSIRATPRVKMYDFSRLDHPHWAGTLRAATTVTL